MNWKKNRTIRRRRSRVVPPTLRFDPTAWAKLLFLRDLGDTEIGGFGLSAEDDPLLVVDVLTVRQRCSAVTIAFDDAAVADLFDRLVDAGIPPARFARIWLHTHPGDCPRPSTVDETTFRRVFGRTDWSVMGIVAQGGATYARLSFHVGPGGALEIPIDVDWRRPFAAADCEAWQKEYAANVIKAAPLWSQDNASEDRPDDWFFDPYYLEEPANDETGAGPV
jgi:hypothetical protein